MSLTYAQIEQQALNIVELAVPEVQNWTRAWTNAGRRLIMQTMNFEEMRQLYPAEAALGTVFTSPNPVGTRRVTAPANFKEIVSDRDCLWFYPAGTVGSACGSPTAISSKPHSFLARTWSLVDTGEPIHFELVRSNDGQNAYFDLYPQPTLVYPLQVDGYFYQPDLGMPVGNNDPDGASQDFISRFNELLVRDAIVSEALAALEMFDAEQEFRKSFAARLMQVQNTKKQSELATGAILAPSFRSGTQPSNDPREFGYPWWGRR